MELIETQFVEEVTITERDCDLYGCDSPKPASLCHCLNISEQEVKQTIAVHDARSVRSVAQICGAGSGCTACHRHIKRLIAQHRQQELLSSNETCAVS